MWSTHVRTTRDTKYFMMPCNTFFNKKDPKCLSWIRLFKHISEHSNKVLENGVQEKVRNEIVIHS